MQQFDGEIACAQQLDADDPLAGYRQGFHLPKHGEQEGLYFCGNSLGLQPKRTADYVQAELDDWAALGVEGHTQARHPWLPYHEFVTDGLAHVVGALPQEVVAMNGLTVNLHLLMVSFYRPTARRFKIMIEQGAFPSDYYAVGSQLRYHGFEVEEGLIELKPRAGEHSLRDEDILHEIEQQGDAIALILLGGVNYLSGQAFDMEAITRAGHAQGAIVGFDLAHAAGNLLLQLHDWQVDFAAWCCYKYLNAGPGGIAGVFVHEKHLAQQDIPRFAGWWGHDKQTRFSMPDQYSPISTVEAWQLSNPPILQLAALRASLEDFVQAGMLALRKKSEQLTAYLFHLLQTQIGDGISIITPCESARRGSQLSLVFDQRLSSPQQALLDAGVFCDFREPNVIRVAPTALYNSYRDVYHLVQILKANYRS